MRPKPKLLVADDETELADSLKQVLEGRGYRVFIAYDGNRALELARTEHPDLIVLDLMLPKLDGYRILKLLKADARYQGIPILVITARADTQDRDLARECGADEFFTKPVALETLLGKISTLIGVADPS